MLTIVAELRKDESQKFFKTIEDVCNIRWGSNGGSVSSATNPFNTRIEKNKCFVGITTDGFMRVYTRVPSAPLSSLDDVIDYCIRNEWPVPKRGGKKRMRRACSRCGVIRDVMRHNGVLLCGACVRNEYDRADEGCRERYLWEERRRNDW